MARPSTLEFLKTETGAGALLGLAALAAVIIANSPAAHAYFGFIHSPLVVRLGAFDQTRSVLSWTRDALMAVFFLVVGMEIKFEVLRGEFSSPRRLALPIFAAVGGLAGPVLVYLAINTGEGGSPGGWPVVAPTDVACALAALAVFGRRLPQSLRLFLLTLAMADDLGAIGLIGLMFTAPIHPVSLTWAAVILTALAALSRWKTAPRLFYAAGFVLVWAFSLQSGVNTAVAGFACALTVPIGARRADQEGVLKTFMENLHPYVAFGVLPFFAFVSAGFAFADLGWRGLISPMPLGVVIGLLVGKPLGVMAFSLLGVASRLARRPLGTLWIELLGVSLLGGAGFTLSFFIGALAFDAGDPSVQGRLRAAIILGSLLSVLAGGAVLAWAQARREDVSSEAS
jgi:NhaA family Na+:H+ antiporter